MADDSDTIDEFCRSERFSRAHFYNLLRAGKAPRTMKNGARRTISAEAKRDWHREREAATRAADEAV